MIMLCITFISRLDGDVSMMKMNMSIKSIDLALFPRGEGMTETMPT